MRFCAPWQKSPRQFEPLSRPIKFGPAFQPPSRPEAVLQALNCALIPRIYFEDRRDE